MYLIEIQSTKIPEERQRTDVPEEHIQALADSISRLGLFNPPVFRLNGEEHTLVSGECRYRAIQLLHNKEIPFNCDNLPVPLGFIPVTLLSELDEEGIFEAELEENLRRRDLTWKDRVRAEAKLHEFRRMKKEEAADLDELDKMLPGGTATQTFKQTAAEAFKIPLDKVQANHITSISESVILSKHLNNPIIAGAKDRKEAVKLLRRAAETAERTELAKTVDMNKTPHTLFHGEAIEFMKTLSDNTYDIILTDPPYGIGADTFGKEQSIIGHKYDDSLSSYIELMNQFSTESFRVAATDSNLYMFCDVRNFNHLSMTFSLAGWKVFPWPMTWAKSPHLGMLPWPELGPRHTQESILFAIKGNKRVNHMGISDVISVNSLQNHIHGAQKPVGVYTNLLARSCSPGDYVLDPFCGSGTIFPACNQLKLIATGCELSEEYYNAARSRIFDTGSDSIDLEG